MGLPPCPARRTLPGEPGVYYCAHPQLVIDGQRVTAEVCGVCDLWRQPPPNQLRPFPPPLGSDARRGTCAHLGEEKGLRQCRTCRGHVKVKVFACAHPRHGETTLAECGDCPDYQPRPVASAAGAPAPPSQDFP